MLRFRRLRGLQKFAAFHASVYNLFNSERSLYSRANFKLSRCRWLCVNIIPLALQAHNLKVVGSNLTPATNITKQYQ